MIAPILCSIVAASTTVALPEPPVDFVEQSQYTFSIEPDDGAQPSLALLQDEAAPQFGMAGSAYWLAMAAAGSDLEADHFGRGGMGVSYFMADDLSIDVELNFGYYRSMGDDALGANFNLLFRWHFWRADDRSWTVYIDGGAGMLFATDEVPRGGSNFNFTPQGGLGASWDIGDNRRLLVGARWHHISNARLYDTNPGQDHAMLYVMLAWPF